MICTYLIETTKNPAIPGIWLSFAAAIGLTAALITRGMQATTSAGDASAPVNAVLAG